MVAELYVGNAYMHSLRAKPTIIKWGGWLGSVNSYIKMIHFIHIRFYTHIYYSISFLFFCSLTAKIYLLTCSLLFKFKKSSYSQTYNLKWTILNTKSVKFVMANFGLTLAWAIASACVVNCLVNGSASVAPNTLG